MKSATETPSTPRKHLFSVDEYYRLAEVGILGPDENVELIDGEIMVMERRTPPHAACTSRFHTLLFSMNADRLATVGVHHPIRLSDHSEPQPDLALLRPREDFYAQAHPGPADVLLIVEVSDASEEYDRHVKVPLYARSGIPEVWLVKLTEDVIIVYSQLQDGVYRDVREARRGQTLSPGALPHLSLPVDAILG